ncbi:helix-turn-helix protein [Paraburkholderia sp. BL17N1]|nr:helix-turn-helix protein [Paraburkholderia sp. BL17N1]
MPDKTSYQQLQPEERLTIASLPLEDASIRAMARILGRSSATVSRELTRNSSSARYASMPAEALSAARRSAGPPPHQALPAKRLLAHRSHPARLEMVAPADIGHTEPYVSDRPAPTQQASHESVYTAIYAQPRGELPACATAIAPVCRARGAPTGAGRFPTWSVFTCARPKSETVCCLGIGKATSSTAPEINRLSAFWLNVPAAWCCSLRWKTPPPLRRWRAYLPNSTRLPHRCDKPLPTTRAKRCRGIKTSLQPLACAFTSATHTVLAARGACENTNGLLRQYLRKVTNLSVYSQHELNAIADSRPPATHTFHSPFEVFSATLASASQPHGFKH